MKQKLAKVIAGNILMRLSKSDKPIGLRGNAKLGKSEKIARNIGGFLVWNHFSSKKKGKRRRELFIN